MIPDLGVGVTLYEILDIQGGTIYPLEGAAMFKVTFSLVRFGSVTNSWRVLPAPALTQTHCASQVVFRPFVGEVMTGRIVSADRRGLQVCAFAVPSSMRKDCRLTLEMHRVGDQISLGFFDDVFIPSTALQEPSVLCVGCIRASSEIRFLTHCAAPCSDEAEHTWRWMYEGNVLFMDVDEEVRVRMTPEYIAPMCTHCVC